MNIEQANTITIAEILGKVDIFPIRETKTLAFYRSPIRISHNADFEVNKLTNTWTDRETGQSGSLVDMVQEYLKYHKESYTIYDALRYIRIMSGNAPRIHSINTQQNESNDNIIIENAEPLGHPGLFNQLTERGINLHIAMKYLQEVTAFDTKNKKVIVCLGSENDNGGFDLQIRGKNCGVGERYLRFIRGTNTKPDSIQVFKDIYDFLSVLTSFGWDRLKDDAVIIPYNCLDKLTPYVAGYGYSRIVTWFDNDETGSLATQAIADFVPSEIGLVHKRANAVYANHKNINQWHMHQHNLPAHR